MASARFLTPLERLLQMENMSDRINRLLSDRGRPEQGQEESMSLVDWVPAMDVVETATEFLIRAELPGVDKSNVKISVEDGVLTIAGHREQEREEKGKRFHRVERAYGPFARKFTVPDIVDATKVSADFTNGVLTITLPKSEKARPKAIEVTVA